eukprot:c26550_g1_i1.p1 GENE.c26550_g1_i1~~c26550_g1_i1.p1  ORF type:complete len:281 (+),score=37.45 c26550_g1_i1:113-955(+)
MHSPFSLRVFRLTSPLWNRFVAFWKHPIAHPEVTKSKTRLQYFDAEHRPRFRGSLVAWLHRTLLWAFIAATYIGISFFSLAPISSTLFRVKFSVVTLWGLWASDYLHNLDRILPASHYHGKRDEIQKLEKFYFQHDLISISSILTTNYLVWADNFNFRDYLPAFSIVSVVCTLFLAAVVVSLFHRSQEIAILISKLVIGFQFIGLYGYMLVSLYSSSVLTLSTILVWAVYGLGMVCYVLKPFLGKFERMGPHEAFHMFVFSGHLLSMIVDVAFMIQPTVA